MNVVFYVIIVLLQPIFNMLYMYYTIFTIKQQTWGGIRVDRAKSTDYTLTNTSDNTSDNTFDNTSDNTSDNNSNNTSDNISNNTFDNNYDSINEDINEDIEIVIHKNT